MRIREATLDDAEAIAHLENISYGHYDPTLELPSRRLQDGERLAATMTQFHEQGFVAEENGNLLAVALWRPCGEPVRASHLHLLFIHPERLRQGLGERFLRMHWERSLADWPELEVFTLNVLRGGYWSRPFYEKHGYREYQEGDEAGVPGLDAYLPMLRDSGRDMSGMALYYLPAAEARAC